MTRLCIALLLALTLGGSAASAQRAAVTGPRTLVSTPGAIRAFAQDGNAVGYIGSNFKVHVKGLSGPGRIVGSAAGSYAKLIQPSLALAGGRALWTRYGGGNLIEIHIDTGASTGRGKQVDTLGRHPISSYGGDFFGGLVGDGTTLVYGWAHICDVGDGVCPRFQVDGGGVRRVRSSARSTIPDVPPAFDVAVSQQRIAVVPAAFGTSSQLDALRVPQPVENGPVHVFDLGGHVLSSFAPVGTVREVALAWPQAAVLVQQQDDTKAIARYDARTGALSDETAVPAAAVDLSMSAAGIVYRVGATIHLLRQGSELVIGVRGIPVGLSIEGRRIAWAVNLKGHGFVRALTVSS